MADQSALHHLQPQRLLSFAAVVKMYRTCHSCRGVGAMRTDIMRVGPDENSQVKKDGEEWVFVDLKSSKKNDKEGGEKDCWQREEGNAD